MSEEKSKIIAKDKEVVVPGEVLAEGMDYVPGTGTYRKDDKIMAQMLGLANVNGRAVKLIRLAGKYNPKKDDTVIGKVTDINIYGWNLDINSPYTAMLNIKDASSSYIERGADLTKYFEIGDYLVSKITNVTSQNLVDLTMKGPGLRKLKDGRIIHVNPHKVPRIIGKKGSMVNLVKDETDCNITVGQNGRIWIQGKPKDMILAVETLKKIERESHKKGLTDEISKFLKEKK